MLVSYRWSHVNEHIGQFINTSQDLMHVYVIEYNIMNTCSFSSHAFYSDLNVDCGKLLT